MKSDRAWIGAIDGYIRYDSGVVRAEKRARGHVSMRWLKRLRNCGIGLGAAFLIGWGALALGYYNMRWEKLEKTWEIDRPQESWEEYYKERKDHEAKEERFRSGLPCKGELKHIPLRFRFSGPAAFLVAQEGMHVFLSGGVGRKAHYYEGDFKFDISTQPIPICEETTDDNTNLTILFVHRNKRIYRTFSSDKSYPLFRWRNLEIELFMIPHDTIEEGVPDEYGVRPTDPDPAFFHPPGSSDETRPPSAP